MSNPSGTQQQPLTDPETHTEPLNFLGVFAGVWGLVGVLTILGRGLWQITPLALEPFERGLSVFEWVLYAVCIVFMAYSEGYKGFQKAFSPRVVARALYLARHPRLLHVLLAPAFCMALFHATRKRLIVSWVLALGILALVLTVPLLPYPWRNIIDAGVVIGLGWGTVSLIVFAAQALFSGKSETSPEVPTPQPQP